MKTIFIINEHPAAILKTHSNGQVTVYPEQYTSIVEFITKMREQKTSMHYFTHSYAVEDNIVLNFNDEVLLNGNYYRVTKKLYDFTKNQMSYTLEH